MTDDATALEKQQLNQSASELGTFWHRVRSAVVTDLLDANGAQRVADVSAGAGHFGGWLRRHKPSIEYRFLEPLDDVRAQLVRRFGSEQQIDEIAAIGDVDAVTMLDVLEHIEDDHGFLLELHSALPSGALLVLTVPANQALFSHWDEKLGHFRRYSRSSLSEVLTSAGFEVETTRFLFPELQPPAALRKLRRSAADSGAAEFPALPRVVDRAAFAFSRSVARLGRATPGGTSILASARRS